MNTWAGKLGLRLFFSAVVAVVGWGILAPDKAAASAAPSITTQPQSQSVVAGSNVVLFVVASGQGTLNYQWSLNGTDLTNSAHINGATDATLTISDVVASDAGNYQVVVSNSHGSVTSSNAALTVLVPAGITAQPVSQAVLLSSNAAFTVSITGTEPLSCRWYFNGTPLTDGGSVSGAETTNLNISNAQTNDAGSYQLVVTNNYGSATSLVATLTVLVPVQIIRQPSSEAVQLNNDASFSVTAIGSFLSYQWYFNGAPLSDGNRISGSSTPTLKIASVQNSDLGGYFVSVTNSFSSATSQTVFLTPQAPFTFVTNANDTVTITGFSGALYGSVTIPDWVVVNGVNLPVTEIGPSAFYNQMMTSVTMGGNLRAIDIGAFEDCGSLTNVIIGPNVAAIGVQAFLLCTNLDGIIIPDSVTSIGSGAFQMCSGLTNITIPNSVTSMMGNSTFEKCVSLVSVALPNSLDDIGWDEFYGCSNLTSLTLPASLTNIENNAFGNCWSLTNVVIPNGVLNIGGGAFSGCLGLTHLNLPSSVANIGTYAFSYCTRLTSMTIPFGVASIMDDTFSGCSSLTNVTLPTSVTNLGIYAFGFCTSLTNILIPNGVTTIGNNAFTGCSSLTDITMPDSVVSIGSQAFEYCSSLRSARISVDATNFGWGGFQYCVSLTNIVIPGGVGRIGDSAFYECGSLATVTISNGVTSVGYSAFQECHSLTGITIPDSVTNISDYAFMDCTRLINFGLGNNVLDVGTEAFDSCISLTNMVVPKSTTNIGDRAFYACTSLVGINVDDLNPDYSSLDGVLFNKDQTLLIQYPGGKPGVYAIPDGVTGTATYAFGPCANLTAVTIPESLTNLGRFAFYTCTSLTTITVDALNPVYSSLNGVLFDKNRTTLIAYPAGRQGAYIVPNGIKSIDGFAFAYCGNLTSVVLPSSLTNLWGFSFHNCTNLIAAYFSANAPGGLSPNFDGDPNVIIYYLPETSGWTSTFDGHQTAPWLPQLQTDDGNFGVTSNQFGFNLSWASGQTVVVEACTNLADPVWQPVQTNTLVGNSSYFSDPHWTNYPGRFYRLRSP